MNGMVTSLVGTFLPIIFALLMLMAFSAAMILKSDVRTRVKLIGVPLALFAAVYVPMVFWLLLGYAFPHALPEDFTYLSHRTIVQENKKTNIEVWVALKNKTRLFLIPYNKNMEKELEQAKKDTSNGKQVQMHHKGTTLKKGSGKTEEGDEYPYSMESKSPSEANPKTEPAPEGEPESTAPTPPKMTV